MRRGRFTFGLAAFGVLCLMAADARAQDNVLEAAETETNVFFPIGNPAEEQLKRYEYKIYITPPDEQLPEFETSLPPLVKFKFSGDDWPAILKLKTQVRGGVQSCTATLIGPQVILTAAHCIETQRHFTAEYYRVKPEQRRQWEGGPGFANSPFSIGQQERVAAQVTCTPHPLYRPRGIRASLDYALCFLADPYPNEILLCADTEENGDGSEGEPTAGNETNADQPECDWQEVKFENLSTKRSEARLLLIDRTSRSVLLVGSGCQDRFQTPLEGDEISIGRALIGLRGSILMQTGNLYRSDSATLCPGDSGGPAFREFPGGKTVPERERKIIGVNSQVFERGGVIEKRSIIAKTSSIWFVRFLRDWLRANGNPFICGVSEGEADLQARCRNAS